MGFLKLQINEISYNKGETVNARLIPIKDLGLSNFSLKTIKTNVDTIITECRKELVSEYYSCTQLLEAPGEYTIFGEATLANGEKVVSNKEFLIVQDINIELKDLTQDKFTLIRVAHNSGGSYMPIDSLDRIFSHIEITPIKLINNYQISGLSTQYYWWLLIVLLAAEWFIRKKLGLL